jgi:ATP-dependent Clp protease ATP-binding subunit ClpB
LQNPLADLILKGEVVGGMTLKVDEGDGGLVIVPA